MTIKKTLALFAALLTMSAGAAAAHPPTDIAAAWNKADGTLSISASHQVNDNTKHYIMTLVVMDGNKQLLMKKYTQQAGLSGFSDKVQLSGVKPGTKLTIELTCNIMGSASKEITAQ